MLTRLLVHLGCVLLLIFGMAAEARADEVAPAIEGADLRALARDELQRLTSTLTDAERERLTGMYVAVDATATDPLAQVACDDDGDYVVLVSDAMLRLVSHVARAASLEDEGAARKVEAYASVVARMQLPGQRLLPPGAGFFPRNAAMSSYGERLGEAIAFVIAEELERLVARDLVCPNPTPTRERGDSQWTIAESARARGSADATYPGHQLERLSSAFHRVRASGGTNRGALAVARFFVAFESERQTGTPASFVSSYARLHPSPNARLARLNEQRNVEPKAHNPRTSGPTGPREAPSVRSLLPFASASST